MNSEEKHRMFLHTQQKNQSAFSEWYMATLTLQTLEKEMQGLQETLATQRALCATLEAEYAQVHKDYLAFPDCS